MVKVSNPSPEASEVIPYAAPDEDADIVPAFVMSVTSPEEVILIPLEIFEVLFASMVPVAVLTILDTVEPSTWIPLALLPE